MIAEVQRTITDVQNRDAAWRADAAAAPEMDHTVEGATLRTLLADEGVCDRCKNVTGARWGSCAEARLTFVFSCPDPIH